MRLPRHAPPDYACPFCAIAARRFGPGVHTTPEDLVYEDPQAVAFVSSLGFGPHPGHVLVIPRAHYESLYDLPDEAASAIAATVRRIAIALRTGLDCQGISTRQHNEPAGDQDVWHYHTHVFPRYEGDGLYTSPRVPVPPERRRELAEKIREALGAEPSSRPVAGTRRCQD